MTRLIFSIYENVNDNSINNYKKQQLLKYKDVLVNFQEIYAKKCNAEYKLVETTNIKIQNEYDSIQFSKLKYLYEFTKDYDEVLYLDLDILPKINIPNIFDTYDFSKLVCFFEDCEKRMFDLFPNKDEKYRYINELDHMSWWIKMAAKNSMLLLEDYSLSEFIINTGVVGANYQTMKNINFHNELTNMNKLLDEAKDDNLYPPESSQFFRPNNEIYFTYLVEKKNIAYEKLDESWNYILDDIRLKEEVEANFLHIINKDFNSYLYF